ncbi:MAG: thymidylate kinase [Mycoplasmatota bacterium]
MKGKLIVVEGTDCSGKETQTNLLLEKFRNEEIKCEKFSFPNYNSPTGKIVGGPYLGKQHISAPWFPEGANNVDPLVASLYYAADRKYNIDKILFLLENGCNVILDRYVYSNMAHQGGKESDIKKRKVIYEKLSSLEFGLLELPEPDIKVFLHMPFIYALELKKNREEEADQHESNEEHLKNAEASYLEIADLFNFDYLNCVKDNRIKTIEEINIEVMALIKNKL